MYLPKRKSILYEVHAKSVMGDKNYIYMFDKIQVAMHSTTISFKVKNFYSHLQWAGCILFIVRFDLVLLFSVLRFSTISFLLMCPYYTKSFKGTISGSFRAKRNYRKCVITTGSTCDRSTTFEILAFLQAVTKLDF